MVDKLTAVKREHIGKKIGRIGGAQATELDHALRLWLDLGAR